jgi:signal peptidase II
MQDSTKRPFLWLFALLAVVGLATDQASKYVIFAKLYPADAEWETKAEVIPGYVELRTAYTYKRDSGEGVLSFLRTERLPHVNRGALFGIGNGNGDPESGGMNGFFAIVSVLAACFIVIWALRPTVAHDRFLCIALGLILGGTLGNLYDRLVFEGVRDFLHCYYDTHVWPDFNIADCCLVCGAGTLLVHSVFVAEPEKTEPTLTETTAPMQTTSPTPGA